MVTRPGAPIMQYSVLDRLLLGETTPVEGRTAQAKRMREAVRRDLEALFNTRTPCRSWPRHLRQLNRSILSYGLPDLQTRTIISEASREALRGEVQAIIRRFEPRLKRAVVELVGSADPLDRSLRFRIHGDLVLEEGREPIIYDTQVDSASRAFRIAQAERDRDS